MSAGARTRLRLQEAVQQPERKPFADPKVEAARQRHGKPFAFEAGTTFNWSSGASVLNRWLAKRTVNRGS